ncbi:MAG: BlaI/MecI/CopY family transcriptional regulator [Calditrichia bacterium]|nr:BlaI/MecI/CopY family transcriptional regulator [Calditrichota bacterium]MCB0270844.1 BlaI/MecI/CopY family transcriptional regulator [Calditrichota bacterium]MCB0286105.1 BlaI/MecI/CopY family transcriptional regulator [Calditrichota bacterium]MCB9067319.1 BlaI/MecI/CopY family transcriptional regulator [Calditrichia bacterium]
MAKKDITLSEQQMEIMRVLWRGGEATVQDVREALSKDKPLATTTVATMLSRLEKRGIIDHKTDERQYVYFPLVSENEVRRSMVKDLVSNVFRGDFAALMSHLVKESEIDPDDLESLKQMIDEQEKKEDQQ